MRRPLALLALVFAAALSGCGDTLQNQPIAPRPLESVIVKSRVPVYWAGLRFAGMDVSNVILDPGGAVTIQYGNCLIGGQYTCVAPLSIVTSADNSFLPGDGVAARPLALRGAQGRLLQGGRTIVLRTGAVVVSIYAHDRPALALAAARTIVALNEGGLPGEPLPAPQPDTHFDGTPLPSQVPPGGSLARP